jgi:hypothetical protein
MGHQFMNFVPRRSGVVAATTILLFASASARATEPDIDRFKSEIEAFVDRLSPSSNGIIKWIGSDTYEVRRDGDQLLATFENARLGIETQQPAQLIVDRVEIRETGRRDEDSLIELALALPKDVTLRGSDGTETNIALKGARATAVVEARSGRGRETVIALDGGRIEQSNTGTWVSLGPLSMSSKLAAEPNGGWVAPVEFEVKGIEFFLPEVPLGGAIDRIAYSGRTRGPSLAELDKLRDALDLLRAPGDQSPQARAVTLLGALATTSKPFSDIGGEVGLDGLTMRSVTGESLVVVAKAGSAAEITGLDAEQTALRFSVRQEGLDLAPSIMEEWKVPRRILLDIGVADLDTQALAKLLHAFVAATDQRASAESESEANRQQTIQQALGAAAMLNPTFRIYDLAIDTEEAGMDLAAEAKGSPLAPKSYAASGDLKLRGFDAITKLSDGMSFAEYLPVLRQIGVDGMGLDGAPRLVFHLASAPPKWLTINGNDVSAWFDGGEVPLGRPRLLKLTDPPMQGSDVASVQRALAAAQVPVERNGEYNSATAGAVARFQKQKGLNVNGIVDAATRERLGGLGDTPPQGGRN